MGNEILRSDYRKISLRSDLGKNSLGFKINKTTGLVVAYVVT